MNAPDRSVEVIGIVNQHFDLFGTDDTRRGILFFVCRDLNLVDEGRWGVLVKTDQNNFIPSDIIIDAVTREHFDVLAGDPDRPSWQPRGVVTNPAWLWQSAELVKPTNITPVPIPPAPPEPPAPVPLPPAPEDDLTGAAVLRDMLADLERFVHAVEVIADSAQRISETLRKGVHLDVQARL
jgi:hypothetical protein